MHGLAGILGGVFFAAAAVYLAVAATPGPVSITAAVLCVVCAGLSVRYPVPATVVGTIMITGSLTLQLWQGYYCKTCLVADAVILCGIICVVLQARLRRRIPGLARQDYHQ